MIIQACGEDEKNPCDELLAIQKEICQYADQCFPCACILRDEGWELRWDALGRPDFLGSSCSGSLGACEGAYRDLAEGCLELGKPEKEDGKFKYWAEDCDPRIILGVWLFDDNENYAFPEVCAGGW
jgi:hypothetical protein